MDIKELSDELIAWGSQQRMQDMYIECLGDNWRVLFRKGEAFLGKRTLTEEQAKQLITRFKYLGDMDVGEMRKVQLGAISYRLPEEFRRLRLSLVGDYRLQESMVIRFLYPLSKMEQCFLVPSQYELIKDYTRRRGLYLFSGATGSGKTTLMYRLARFGGRVLTIEDPVEIEETSFTQLQVNPAIGQSYDLLIQLALRHRPDVLIIGEIRDQETAQAAIRAALTGCKVFATVHASSVAATKSRLRDLVGNDSELTDCLAGVIYQRLLLTKTWGLGALLAYEFPDKEAVNGNWQTNLESLLQQGEISEECFFREI